VVSDPAALSGPVQRITGIRVDVVHLRLCRRHPHYD
jgi:hypothetical protein